MELYGLTRAILRSRRNAVLDRILNGSKFICQLVKDHGWSVAGALRKSVARSVADPGQWLLK